MTSNGKRSHRSTGTNTARAAAKTAPAATRPAPVLVVSIAAIVIGLVIVGILLLAGGLPGSRTSGAIATPMIPTPTDHANGRSLGSAGAPVQIDLWADFQCPVCARFSEQIEPYLVTRYVEPGLARLTFHDMAFLGPESLDAAVAARVADAQAGAFWPMHDLLYANQGAENSGAFSRDRLAAMAATIGLPNDAFLAAMDDPAYLGAVRDETARGQALGVSATPTMIINGQAITGLPDLTKLTQLLDGLVAAAASTAP